ncbi:MAG: DUF2089 family protein [Myxococcota bacterium]
MELLTEEDLAFVRRFILASGSLKDVAGAYGISYPTVRLRLDRLIAKIELAEANSQASDFERALRAEMADGNLDGSTMKRLLKAYQRELGKQGGTP